MKLTVVVPDCQVPFHHERGIRSLARFIEKRQPDLVLQAGDMFDFPSLSRWHRGLAGEYDQSLGKQRDEGARILNMLNVQHMIRSNHDDRVDLYIKHKAPALDGLEELRFEKFARLDEMGIKFHRDPFEFVPGWHLMHGDEGGLSSDPGKTALNLAKRVGGSVVCGHTHRMGVQPFTESVGGTVKQVRYGVEAGCLMDMRKAAYIMERGGFANWQLGFVVVYTRGTVSVPVLVPMEQDGSFIFEGKHWR